MDDRVVDLRGRAILVRQGRFAGADRLRLRVVRIEIQGRKVCHLDPADALGLARDLIVAVGDAMGSSAAAGER